MAREVIWTGPGWDDLEAAAEYVARDSQFYAAALVHEARDAAASLSDFAERGQVVPEFSDESILSGRAAAKYLAAAAQRLTVCSGREIR